MCGSDQTVDGGTVYKRLLIQAILQTENKVQKLALTGRCTLGR
jgi:hypothetical protein